jgi:transcriptional regulator CtsR
MNYNVNEEELLERLVPRVESRISSKIVQRIIDALKEELYPPEDMIREEFVKEIEEAEKEKGKTFKNIVELESYLKGLAE